MKEAIVIFLLVSNSAFCFFTDAFSQGWGWEWQNPLPQGNLVHSLDAVTANHAWFGTSAGVVLHTSDGGRTWQLQQTPSLAWIEGIDFIDTEYGWAVGDEQTDIGTERSVILHTRDGGKNWLRQPWPAGLSEHTDFNDVAFYDRQRGWIIGGESVILFTDDGGETWENQRTHISPSPGGLLEDISIVDSSVVWAVGKRTIIHTLDAGKTWEKDTSDVVGVHLFEEVHFVDEDHGWMLAAFLDDNFYRTVDGGQNWTLENQDVYGDVSSVFFLNPDSGWVLASGGVFRTEDGGESWQLIFSEATGSFIFVNDSIGWSSFVFRTRDGGRNWQNFTSNVTYKALWAVDFVDTNYGWAVGTGGTIIATTDGGKSWSPQNSGLGNRLVDVQFLNRKLGWVVGFTNMVLRTSDGGETWQSFNSNPPHPENRAVCFVDSLQGWVVGGDVGDPGWIRYSGDSGMTWRDRTHGVIPRLLDVFFLDRLHGWVVGDIGYIAHTKDGGINWEIQRKDTNERLTEVYFADLKKGWILHSEGNILVTTDGGSSWDSMFVGGFAGGIWDFTFADEQHGWISGGIGEIFFTDDGGQTWERQSSGTSQTLWSIDFVDDNHGWTTGNFGIILHTSSGGVTSVETSRHVAPLSFQLYQNYPNPFNPETKISYTLNQTGAACLSIYNILGKKIKTLVNEIKLNGNYLVQWDGQDDRGQPVASGVYFYQLALEGQKQTKKMLLIH